MRLFVCPRPVGRFVFLTLLPAALLVIIFSLTSTQTTASPSAQVIPAGSLTVLRSDEIGYHFTLVPPSLELEPVQIRAGEFTRLKMKGYGNTRVPGQPDLPQTTVYVALPAGAEPALRIVQAESEIAAINMVYGASIVGARAMTSSSSSKGRTGITGAKVSSRMQRVSEGGSASTVGSRK